MGNIVTPAQGLLPLPAAGIATSPYPWWLNAALAIWALLALLCCWLLLLLYLLRYCCRWWRHRGYAANRQSMRERFFGAGGAAASRQDVYVTKDQHFATAPLPPVPPYAMSNENERAFHDVYERHTVEDDFSGNRRGYATAGALGAAENRAFGSDSGSLSEEEIIRGKGGRSMAGGGGGGVTENIETNVQRNITKNYYINEEQNYFVQPEATIQHEQVIQSLPAPTVTTVNMAAERIADNPNWENANAKENFSDQDPKKTSAQIVANDPAVFEQNVRSERPPEIYTHRPVLRPEPSILSDDGSTTSEMSGHDSESIYETIRIITPKTRPLPLVEDEEEDENKTAGVDEVEIEIQDLVRLQRANPKSTSTYDDILTSGNMARQRLTPRISSSLSSSSTLNNVMPGNAQGDNLLSGQEEKEETVTETIQTQQIQTTYHQFGQSLDGSAFFIPLTHAQETQENDEKKIIIPVTMSSIDHEEQPALQHF